MVSGIREHNETGNQHNETGMPVHPARAGSVDRQYNELLSLAATVAKSKAGVLITGETGTGKRSLARYIHENSSRSSKSFLLLNCRETAPGDQDRMLESHLMQARGSTLILAEVWKLVAAAQTRLISCLRSGEDIRIIATSSRPLAGAVRSGDLKEELYHRLNVVNLRVPSLHERIGDIEVLARSMIASFGASQGRPGLILSEEAVLLLNSHRFPGNLRELQSVCERAVLVAQGSEVRARDIQFQQGEAASVRADSGAPVWRPGRTLDEIERNVILEALKHYSGNRTHTAKALGISIRTLRNKLAEFRVMGIKA